MLDGHQNGPISLRKSRREGPDRVHIPIYKLGHIWNKTVQLSEIARVCCDNSPAVTIIPDRVPMLRYVIAQRGRNVLKNKRQRLSERSDCQGDGAPVEEVPFEEGTDRFALGVLQE